MIFDKMVCAPRVLELIARGNLVSSEYYAPNKPDLTKLKVRCGDFVKEGIANLMDRPQMVGDIVTNYAKICPDRKALVFATSVKHSIHIAERFNGARYFLGFYRIVANRHMGVRATPRNAWDALVPIRDKNFRCAMGKDRSE